MSDNGTERPECPTITCNNCGTEHHYDARGGHCRECNGYLREATPEEHEQFGEFLEWNTQTEADHDE
ncbi:hypothetical protein [Natrinema thermotolerans]|uniref:hypothetical protein n=1 Tax=Natrinema thermotolerans TaxID=121872 RepID=UPI00067955EC|nr:hypothetical protein [Natrinema thermotolerans]QCC57344.1 hypothetical protein DVR14_01295 [Natrinema thermotolerans]